jgi:hypothetical protein
MVFLRIAKVAKRRSAISRMKARAARKEPVLRMTNEILK